MSIQAMSWVMAYSEARLGDRLVLLAIANHANAGGTAAWPSISTIAEETRMSTRQVKRAVQHLHDIGELVIEPEAGPFGVHRYCILMGDRMSPPSVRMSPPTSDNMSPGGDKSGKSGGQDVTQTFLEPSLEDSEANASAERDPAKEMWGRGKVLLGKSAGRLIGQALKTHTQFIVMEAILATEAENSPDPVAFFFGCLRQSKKENPHDAETRAFRLVTSGAGDSGPDSALALAFLDPAGTG